MDVILFRDNLGNMRSNIPHHIKKKNVPFEWGNMTDGSIELALNILNIFCDELTSNRLYKKFITDVLAKVPFGGEIIKGNEIEAWIADNQLIEREREQKSFIIAVYRQEINKNQIHIVEAYTEKESIIRACEYYETNEYIQSMVDQLEKLRFDDICEYYWNRQISFSDPQVINKSRIS
ncbi:DUF6166 domain-containing protein [Heyndrickxia sp. FSL W8-0496]|uniref:DUF6166 domain-containing protein n=1 Tax=Heyndrickxia TaxID=2837504 RepID=UPI0030F87BAB